MKLAFRHFSLVSSEFSFERELLRDRPLLGKLSADLILLQKGGNIDHMVDKERVLPTGVIKAVINAEGIEGFQHSVKQVKCTLSQPVCVQ